MLPSARAEPSAGHVDAQDPYCEYGDVDCDDMDID